MGQVEYFSPYDPLVLVGLMDVESKGNIRIGRY